MSASEGREAMRDAGEKHRARARKGLTALAAALVLGAALATPVLAAEEAPSLLWDKGHNCGFSCVAAGETKTPRGLVADPATGNLYVVDPGNSRIQEWTPWGGFIRAWGWGVSDGSPEAQICTAETSCQRGIEGGGAGQFSGPQGIASDSAGDLYVVDLSSKRIQKFDPEGHFLRAWGGGVISGGAAGTGTLTSDSTEVTALLTTSKAFLLGQTITGAGIPAGTTITGLGLGSLTLSKPASASGSGVALTTPEGAGNVPTDEQQTVTIEGAPSGGSFTLTVVTSRVLAFGATRTGGSNQVTIAPNRYFEGTMHVGDAIEGNGIPAATTIAGLDIAAGTITLSANATSSGSDNLSTAEISTALPFNASAAEVQEALEALAGIGAAGVAVAGPAGGPYTVTFEGPLLGDVNVAKLSAKSALTPAGTVSVATPVEGAGAAEICAAAASCQQGAEGTANGQFSAWPVASFIAVATKGTASTADDVVYVGDKNRIEKFDANGSYTGQIALPEAGQVGALAVDNDPASPNFGDLYFSFADESFGNGEAKQPNVFRLDPTSGSVLATLKVDKAKAIVVGAGGSVYVFDGTLSLGKGGGDPLEHKARVLKFNSAGAQSGAFFEKEFEASTGLATSSACGIAGADLFVSSSSEDSFVRAYGPPPDPTLCPPPALAPEISSQYALSVDTDGATLAAKINPHFWPDTTYYVQYGTGKCSEGGCEEKALFPGAQLPGGVQDAAITTPGVLLGGLASDTTYHYRFVAQSSGGGPVYGLDAGQAEGTLHTFPAATQPNTECPNQAFRTGAGALLPDCRAYELVSPLDKNNNDVAEPAEGHDLSSAGGDALTFSVLATPFGDAVSAPLVTQYMSYRDPQEGWQTQGIDPPRKLPLLIFFTNEDPNYKAFSDDLCSGWLTQVSDVALAPGAPAGVPNLYRRGGLHPGCGKEGGYELLTTVAPTEPAPGFSEETEPANSFYFLEFQGASADGSLSVFRAPAKLTEEAANKDIRQVYAESEGQLRLVSVLPNGSAAGTHSSAGTKQSGNGLYREDSLHHAVSEDGSKVFWTACQPAGSCENPAHGGGGSSVGNSEGQLGKLYVRLNPTKPQSKIEGGKCTQPVRACTLEVSEAPGARFIDAAADGSKALYTLGEELYEYDTAKAIAEEAGVRTRIAKGVKGVMGASEDAARVYLASSEVCSGEGENSEAAKAQAGKPNLYLYEAGEKCSEGNFAFIATLAAHDGGAETESGGSSPVNVRPHTRTSRVSPNGLHAAFTSEAPLTGYDNVDAQSGQPDTEVYLYDASANGGKGRLLCASCNPSGQRPAGREVAIGTNGAAGSWAAALLPGWIDEQHPGRLLSEDGMRLFFESYEALSPRDTNGKEDVYEWEAPGSGDCTAQSSAFAESDGGCITLISSGQSAEDSELLDASAGGRDVFLTTFSSLLSQDYSLRDVYDARVDGGFPEPPPQPPSCEGEACQGPYTPPNDPTPASSAYEGPGNPTPTKKKRLHKRGRKKAHHEKHRAHGRHAKRRANGEPRTRR